MTKLQRLLRCAALATAGAVLSAPVAAQFVAALDHSPDGSANQAIRLALTRLQDQTAAPHQEVDKNKSGAASGDTQPASAAFSKKPNANSTVSGSGTEDKRKDKNKMKPASSKQEEEFEKPLLGIYG